MTSTRARYTGYRFPAEIIGHTVWLYFRFPLGLRMVEKLLGFICSSRRRVGCCEFSARLLSPLCWRCSTPGMICLFAARHSWPASR